MLTMTPFKGRARRWRRSSCRKSRHPSASTERSESWVVYRPAVSRNTAWSVNHQSHWRVPPTPRTASWPSRAASGNCRPELRSSVVLPDPGGPISRYHGSWPRPLPRRRCSRASASSKRRSSWLRSLARRCVGSSPWRSAWPMRCSRRRLHQRRTSTIPSTASTSSRSTSSRAVAPASGTWPATATQGPPNHTSSASSNTPAAATQFTRRSAPMIACMVQSPGWNRMSTRRLRARLAGNCGGVANGCESPAPTVSIRPRSRNPAPSTSATACARAADRA